MNIMHFVTACIEASERLRVSPWKAVITFFHLDDSLGYLQATFDLPDRIKPGDYRRLTDHMLPEVTSIPPAPTCKQVRVGVMPLVTGYYLASWTPEASKSNVVVAHYDSRTNLWTVPNDDTYPDEIVGTPLHAFAFELESMQKAAT